MFKISISILSLAFSKNISEFLTATFLYREAISSFQYFVCCSKGERKRERYLGYKQVPLSTFLLSYKRHVS